MQKSRNDIEYLYDTYSPMLYGIALQISGIQSDAEEIVIGTFQKIDTQSFEISDPKCCVMLIKLIIQTAHELLGDEHFKDGLKLKQFEIAPIFHQMICEQWSLESYCEEKKLKRTKIIKMFRAESVAMRKRISSERMNYLYNQA